MLIAEILKRGKLKSMSAEAGIGSTGEAHLAVLDGKKYLLRICKNEETAEKYLGYYKKFKKYGFFPKLLESTSKYVLFDFIDGKSCSENESLKVIYMIGRIAAEINKARADFDYQKSRKFFKKLKDVEKKNVLSKEILSKIKEVYEVFDKKIKLRSSLEAGDLTNDNFMIDRNGKVYFVDIEAIKPNIQGYGIAKAFSSWFRKENERKEFIKGYNSVGSMKFLTKEYLDFVTLIFFIDRIRFKSEKGEMKIVERTIHKLENLLSGR